MDQKLPELYRDYGQYSNYRNFPLDIDGLKPVERRVLLSAYKIARNKAAISRKVDSYTTGNFHPHGECYGTIVQLVKQGFLFGQGNFGSNVGVEPTGPAAPRYTQVRLLERTLDLVFKYVNYVEWIDTELEDREPIFLPTMYPICLMGSDPTQGIGFGYKTYIPCYAVEDLHQRLLWLLGIRKRKPTIVPITDCIVTSSKEELEQLLTTGKARIQVEGRIDIDNRANTATLRSWPPGKRFESFLNKFSKELADGMIGFRDASSKETEIIFQVLRERNRDKIFKEFVDKLKDVTKGVISFETIVVDTERNVVSKSVDKMLMDTFNMFSSVNHRMLSEERGRLQNLIEEYNALEIIRPVLADCIKPGYDMQGTLYEIERATGVDRKTAEELIKKYRISKLLTLNTDTSEINKQITELEKLLKNTTDYVLSQYEEFK
jgi:DNA gyrase/topoisomerase IV subunit A